MDNPYYQQQPNPVVDSGSRSKGIIIALLAIGALFIIISIVFIVTSGPHRPTHTVIDETPAALQEPESNITETPSTIPVDNGLANLELGRDRRKGYDERAEYIDQAIEEFRRAVDQDQSATSHNYLADALEEKGLYAEAEEEYKAAIEKDPNHYQSYNDLGYLYEVLGRVNESVAMYRKALEINPEYDIAMSNLGMFWYSEGNYDEAIRLFKMAIRIAPDNYITYNNLGFAYYKKGDLDRAAVEFNNSITINPEFPNAYFGMGLVYMAKEEYKGATFQLEKTVELDPYNYLYQEALARARQNA